MKFQRFAALICALTLSAVALAEESSQYYAGFFDYYYHACPGCALAGTVAPTDRQEFLEQGKYPCPACVDDAADYQGVEAVVRGGTLVIRVPDQWMKNRPAGETADNFEYRYDEYSDDFFDEAGLAEMARQLHGADYRKLLAALDAYDAACREGSSAARSLMPEPAMAREPGIAPGAGGLMMCRRHIGAAWYLVYRPEEASRKRLAQKGSLDIDLYFTVNTLRAERYEDIDNPGRQGFALSVFPGGLWENKAFALAPEKSGNRIDYQDSQAYQSDGDFLDNALSLDIALYRDMDANICVLHRVPAETAPLAGASLLIDGVDHGIRMAGYDDDNTGIFCCVLTDAEANALKNGAPFKITFVDGSDPDVG